MRLGGGSPLIFVYILIRTFVNKMFGHFNSEYYSRIRGCFACGSLQHFVGNCPWRYDAPSPTDEQASAAINATQDNNSC